METKDKLSYISDLMQKIKQGEITGEEGLLALREIIPEKVIYQSVENKCSPEQIAKQKEYNQMRKKYLELSKKQNSIEELRKAKIQRAKLRESFFCFDCKKSVIADQDKNKIKLKKRYSSTKEKIVIENECPHCHGIIRAYGGQYDI